MLFGTSWTVSSAFKFLFLQKKTHTNRNLSIFLVYSGLFWIFWEFSQDVPKKKITRTLKLEDEDVKKKMTSLDLKWHAGHFNIPQIGILNEHC